MSSIRLEGYKNAAAKQVWDILNRAQVDGPTGSVKQRLTAADVDEMIAVTNNATGQDKTEALAAASQVLSTFSDRLPADHSKLTAQVSSFLGTADAFQSKFTPIEQARLLDGMSGGLKFAGITDVIDYREKTNDVVPDWLNVSPQVEAKVHAVIASTIEARHGPVSFLYGVDPGPPMQVNTIIGGNRDVYGWLVRGDNGAAIIDKEGNELYFET
jgi:hypothetical protein